MKSNYDILGNHIRLIDTRNRESITDRVLGINIDKFFMPSVANVIGTDLSKYKLITKGKFACNPMHVGRDERLPVGKRLGLNKVHPHKFRRTLATMAIDKGMPIEQLQQLLGHRRIDTTLQYAMVKQSNVKIAHRKYIG